MYLNNNLSSLKKEEPSDKKNKPEPSKTKNLNSKCEKAYRCFQCNQIPLLKLKDNENKIIINCPNKHENEMWLVHYLTQNEKQSNNKFICSWCSSPYEPKKIYKYCPECQLILCKICRKAHSKKFNNTHKMISIKKMDTICNEHKIIYNYYCNDCSKNICYECLKNHKNHNVINFKDIILSKDDVTVLKDSLINEKKIINEVIDIFNNIITSLRKKFSDIIRQKKLVLQFKNNLANIYGCKENNFQCIENVNNLLFYKKHFKYEKDMNELDTLFELFNYLNCVDNPENCLNLVNLKKFNKINIKSEKDFNLNNINCKNNSLNYLEYTQLKFSNPPNENIENSNEKMHLKTNGEISKERENINDNGINKNNDSNVINNSPKNNQLSIEQNKNQENLIKESDSSSIKNNAKNLIPKSTKTNTSENIENSDSGIAFFDFKTQNPNSIERNFKNKSELNNLMNQVYINDRKLDVKRNFKPITRLSLQSNIKNNYNVIASNAPLQNLTDRNKNNDNKKVDTYSEKRPAKLIGKPYIFNDNNVKNFLYNNIFISNKNSKIKNEIKENSSSNMYDVDYSKNSNDSKKYNSIRYNNKNIANYSYDKIKPVSSASFSHTVNANNNISASSNYELTNNKFQKYSHMPISVYNKINYSHQNKEHQSITNLKYTKKFIGNYSTMFKKLNDNFNTKNDDSINKNQNQDQDQDTPKETIQMNDVNVFDNCSLNYSPSREITSLLKSSNNYNIFLDESNRVTNNDNSIDRDKFNQLGENFIFSKVDNNNNEEQNIIDNSKSRKRKKFRRKKNIKSPDIKTSDNLEEHEELNTLNVESYRSCNYNENELLNRIIEKNYKELSPNKNAKIKISKSVEVYEAFSYKNSDNIKQKRNMLNYKNSVGSKSFDSIIPHSNYISGSANNFLFSEQINSIKLSNGISVIKEINSGIFCVGDLIGEIKIFELSNYKQLQIIKEHNGSINSLVLLHDQTILSASADKTMKKIKLTNQFKNYIVQYFFSGYENDIFKSIELQKGHKILTCSKDEILFLWIREDDLSRVGDTDENYVNSLKFNKGDKVLDILEFNRDIFVSLSDKNIKFWNTNNMKNIKSIKNSYNKCIYNSLCKLNDEMLVVMFYHEIQIINVKNFTIFSTVKIGLGNLNSILKLNDGSLLIAEGVNSDNYNIFFMRQYILDENELVYVSYKKRKDMKKNANNNKKIKALVQFSSGIIVEGTNSENNGNDSGEIIFYN